MNASPENEAPESSQKKVSLLKVRRPKLLVLDQRLDIGYHDIEEEEDGHIYAGRGRRPGVYNSSSGSKSNIYHPHAGSSGRVQNASRSRSTSRPPRAMEVHAHHPRAVTLDPITTRVSVSVERHTGPSMRTHDTRTHGGSTLAPQGSAEHGYSKAFGTDETEYDLEDYHSRYRSTVPGRVVGRPHASRLTSNSQSRSRSRTTEVSPSPGPLTPQDREPLSGGLPVSFAHGYPYQHSNTYRSSKYELGLEQHVEGT